MRRVERRLGHVPEAAARSAPRRGHQRRRTVCALPSRRGRRTSRRRRRRRRRGDRWRREPGREPTSPRLTWEKDGGELISVRWRLCRPLPTLPLSSSPPPPSSSLSPPSTHAMQSSFARSIIAQVRTPHPAPRARSSPRTPSPVATPSPSRPGWPRPRRPPSRTESPSSSPLNSRTYAPRL